MTDSNRHIIQNIPGLFQINKYIYFVRFAIVGVNNNKGNNVGKVILPAGYLWINGGQSSEGHLYRISHDS